MPIITEFDDLQQFNTILSNNPGMVILKLGATWCGPCQQIKGLVHGLMTQIMSVYGEKVVCCDIDVDESFELYALLKTKKMVNGIPAILCWKAGNVSVIPDDTVLGSNQLEINLLFNRCSNHLSLLK
jgi:thiol-disulfide isomerase/thioredoxin